MNVFRMNCHHFLFQMRHQEALSILTLSVEACGPPTDFCAIDSLPSSGGVHPDHDHAVHS